MNPHMTDFNLYKHRRWNRRRAAPRGSGCATMFFFLHDLLFLVMNDPCLYELMKMFPAAIAPSIPYLSGGELR